MVTDEIKNDYRNDWLYRCTAPDKSDYSALNELNIYFQSINCCYEVIESFKDILLSVQKKYAPNLNLLYSVNDNINTALIWSFKNSPIKRSKEINCDKKIYVTDFNIESDQNSIVLYCGNIYGAGLTESNPASENNCTNIMDFFAAQLFILAEFNRLPKGIYYAGHGKCIARNIKYLSDYGYNNIISYEDGKYMLEFSKQRSEERFYFDNTYNGHLHLLHELLFKCLLEFDRICKKHDIKYFLGGGTLLGAVRHQGMIPWDDDMDVMMLRDDYNKFLSVINDELDSSMFFQSCETDPEYHSVFTKIRLNGTKFVTRFSCRFPEMHQGIFIDIFVHDHTSNNKLGQKLHVFKTLFVRSMVFHKWEGTPMHFYGRLKMVCRLATKYIRKTPMKKLEKYQDKVIQKYNKKNTKYLYDGTGEHLRHGAFPAEWLEDVEYLKFNGHDFPVPKNYKSYLKYSYGDYNRWIPASLRKAGHDIIEVDFGEYYSKN